VFSEIDLLTDPLDLPNHEHLCRELGKWFGADDPKISDNDTMRLPGTFNFKPLAHDPNGAPLPVTWAVHAPTGGEYDRAIPSPTRLRQYMHIRKVSAGASRRCSSQRSTPRCSPAPATRSWTPCVRSLTKPPRRSPTPAI
jgi:hypothetical protein